VEPHGGVAIKPIDGDPEVREAKPKRYQLKCAYAYIYPDISP